MTPHDLGKTQAESRQKSRRRSAQIMTELALNALERHIKGKRVKQLRQQDLIPAVIYGRHTLPTSVSIPRRELEQVLRQAGSTQLVRVYVGESSEPHNVLVRDSQRDAITGALLHADLYEVSMTEKITTEIPIVLVGKSPAVDMGLGILVHNLDSIEVECLPGDLIPEIAVDISGLAAVHDSITVADLKVSDKLTLLIDPDETLVTIAPLGREEVEEVVEEAAPTVIGKEEKAAEEDK